MRIIKFLLAAILAFFNDTPLVSELATPVLSFVNGFKTIAAQKGSEVKTQIAAHLEQFKSSPLVLESFVKAAQTLGLIKESVTEAQLVFENISKQIAKEPKAYQDAILFKLASLTLVQLANEEGHNLCQADADTLIQMAFRWSKENNPETVQDRPESGSGSGPQA